MRVIAIILLFGWTSASVAANDVPARQPLLRAAEEYRALLMDGRFDEFERAGIDAATTTTSDGNPGLAAFYAAAVSGWSSKPITEDDWKQRKRRLLQWKQRYPKSLNATVSLAMLPVYYGWAARGNGLADTVTEDRWRIFRKSVEEGRKALENLAPEAKATPGWYQAMLNVGLAQHWPVERFEALYVDGANKFPAYLPIHETAGFYFAPRWYGSKVMFFQFLNKAVERVGAPLGETLYTRIQWALQLDNMFRNGQADWSRMKKGFQQIMQTHPDPWNLNHFARFACAASDWLVVHYLMQRIGNSPIPEAWFPDDRHPESYRSCRATAEAVRKVRERDRAGQVSGGGTRPAG